MLIGGARSGKSDLAVQLAAAWSGRVHVLATAEALDDDMTTRIAKHKADRPADWGLTEEPTNLSAALVSIDPTALLIVDCLTLWTANMADTPESRVIDSMSDFMAALRVRSTPSLVITNEVGLGVHPETALGIRYRDLLGRVNSAAVRLADQAYFTVAGGVVPLLNPRRVFQ